MPKFVHGDGNWSKIKALLCYTLFFLFKNEKNSAKKSPKNFFSFLFHLSMESKNYSNSVKTKTGFESEIRF
jgi:hypothetical protein